ncbi:MAG: hypothetical protein ACYSXF_04460 [Planctomycetota bacterium]
MHYLPYVIAGILVLASIVLTGVAAEYSVAEAERGRMIGAVLFGAALETLLAAGFFATLGLMLTELRRMRIGTENSPAQ